MYSKWIFISLPSSNTASKISAPVIVHIWKQVFEINNVSMTSLQIIEAVLVMWRTVSGKVLLPVAGEWVGAFTFYVDDYQADTKKCLIKFLSRKQFHICWKWSFYFESSACLRSVVVNFSCPHVCILKSWGDLAIFSHPSPPDFIGAGVQICKNTCS